MSLCSRHHGACRRLTVYAIVFNFMWICATSPARRITTYESKSTTSIPIYTSSSSYMSNSSLSSSEGNISRGNQSETAFDDLAKALGMRLVPLHQRNRSPPDYFKHLFKSTSYDDGLTRQPAPYHADEIDGYLDMGGTNQQYYFYNISEMEPELEFLNADLHVYRLGRRSPIRRFRRSAQFIILKIYQVTNPLRKHSPFGNRLIDIKRVRASENSWVVFRIREAVENWISSNGRNNHGIFISAQYSDGRPMTSSAFSFAQKGQHPDRLQPCIAMYKKRKNQTSLSSSDTDMTRAFDTDDPNRYNNIYQGVYYYVPPALPSNTDAIEVHRNSRRKRSLTSDSSQRSVQRSNRNRRSNSKWSKNVELGKFRFCTVHSMQVSFSSMGWDKWIISPSDFDARVCLGRCPFPLGQSYYPTNHAVVQSIWKHVNENNLVGRSVRAPCCVPHTLNALNMLYYDEEFKVVLKSYESMVVTSCGCK